MNRTNPKPKVTINVENLMSKKLEPTDIRRCIVLCKLYYPDLPDYCDTFGDLSGIEPSTLNKVEAMRIVMSYSEANVSRKHPVYLVEDLLSNENIKLSNDGVSTNTKVYKNVLGMLNEKADIKLYLAATSTLLNYYTAESNKGDIKDMIKSTPYADACQVPKYDMTSVRESVRTYSPSATVSREAMYETLVRDQSAGVIVMDSVYDKASSFAVVSEELKKVAGPMVKKKYKYDYRGFVPVSVNPVIVVSDKVSYDQMWMLSILSSSLRGEENGRGSLSVGYYNFDMPPSIVKVVSRAREILYMASKLGFKVVRVPTTKHYSILLLRTLVANGLRVISENGIGACDEDSPADIYSYSKVTCLFIVANTVNQPSFRAKSGITYDSNTKKCLEVFEESKNVRAVLTYLTPEVVDFAKSNSFSLVSSLSPHSCKVWMINTSNYPSKFNDLEERRRMVSAIYHRNIFPLTRRPYYTFDPKRNEFEDEIVVPKIIRKVKRGFDLSMKVTNVKTSYEVVPLASYELVDVVEFVPDKKLLDSVMIKNRIVGMDNEQFIKFYNVNQDIADEVWIDCLQGTDLMGIYNEIKKAMASVSGDNVENPIVPSIPLQDIEDDEEEDFENALGSIDLGSLATVGVTKKM